MENVGSPPLSTSDIQALIASIPRDLSITSSSVTTSKSPSSIGDLSTTSSNSCIFPQLSEMTAISSMLSLSGYPALFNGFPMVPTLPIFNAALPPHATIESLGLINSTLYQQQQIQQTSQSAMCSPTPLPKGSTDTRPRAFSSAATLQHAKPIMDTEKRRKRSRKSDIQTTVVTQSFPCSTSTSTTITTPPTTSLLRSLVEDDDDIDVPHPNKVRPMQVTQEEEELVRKKTQELLKSVPITTPNSVDNGPLRRLIRDEDLPDEVGPDSPFRHYPKYQVHNRSLVHNS